MKIERLDIPDVVLITPPKFGDSRGFFSETFNAQTLQEKAGITHTFLQDNLSLSARRGVVRGLHCQLAPHPQGKLVRCNKGAIWDVAVDAREGSPTFGQWVAAEISEENWTQIWVPPGFLHGFCTLTDNVEVQYKCTDVWSKECERSVLWNCKEIGITWPISEEEAILSDKDREAPPFSAVKGWFHV